MALVGEGNGPGCGFKFAGSRSRVQVRVRRSKPYGNSGAKLYDYDTFTRPPKYSYLCQDFYGTIWYDSDIPLRISCSWYEYGSRDFAGRFGLDFSMAVVAVPFILYLVRFCSSKSCKYSDIPDDKTLLSCHYKQTAVRSRRAGRPKD